MCYFFPCTSEVYSVIECMLVFSSSMLNVLLLLWRSCRLGYRVVHQWHPHTDTGTPEKKNIHVCRLRRRWPWLQLPIPPFLHHQLWKWRNSSRNGRHNSKNPWCSVDWYLFSGLWELVDPSMCERTKEPERIKNKIKALMHGGVLDDRVLLSCLLYTCMYNSLLMVTPDVANEH